MKLSRGSKAGYGAADLGLSGAELLLQLYLLEFYIRVVGLSAWLVGLALALATFWDAVSDPIMGALTDKTRSRLGRFLPYLMSGGVLFGLGIMGLFNPPELSSEIEKFAYLLVAYLFVNTGMTIVGVPHMAMAGALSKDTHERTELYGWRLIFGTVGLFVGILSPLVAAELLHLDVNTAHGMDASRGVGSVLMGGVLILFVMVTVRSTWSRAKTLNYAGNSFVMKDLLQNIRAVCCNRFFLPIFISFLLVAAGRAMNATLALPYYKSTLQLKESVVQGPILSVFTLFIVCSVPLWVYLGKKFGKKWPAFVGMLTLGLMTSIAYPLFPENSIVGPVIAAVVGGIAVGAIILFESMVTDVADRDYIESGQDREGLYFGFWRMGQKLTRSLLLAFTGVLLSLIDYNDQVVEQSEATRRFLAIIFGPGVGLLFILAAIIFLWTPLDRKEQERIQKKKERLNS